MNIGYQNSVSNALLLINDRVAFFYSKSPLPFRYSIIFANTTDPVNRTVPASMVQNIEVYVKCLPNRARDGHYGVRRDARGGEGAARDGERLSTAVI